MKVNFKIPYEECKATSPAFEIMLFLLLLVAALIWCRG